MREIKFRAWAGKQMWSDVATFNNDAYVWNYEETSLVPLFSDVQMRLYGKPILMQYTGVKDINEKEICEGDILKRTDGLNVVIKWSNGSHSFEWYSLSDVHRYWNSDSSQWEISEIVGNIYENLELVK